MPTIEVVYRNRFFPLDTAVAKSVGGGAWEVRIPVSDPIHAKMRIRPEPEAWDGVVFAIDGEETMPAVGSGLTKKEVIVAVLTF